MHYLNDCLSESSIQDNYWVTKRLDGICIGYLRDRGRATFVDGKRKSHNYSVADEALRLEEGNSIPFCHVGGSLHCLPLSAGQDVGVRGENQE